MDADQATYHGRFRNEKKSYAEIRDELINGFSVLRLKPDKGFSFDDAKGCKVDEV